MLNLYYHYFDLDMIQLMRVYQETMAGDRKHPDLKYAEQKLQDYLQEEFFNTPGAFYAVWTEAGKYVSAVRAEPFDDGYLLTGLETAPGCRRKGYATRLIQATIAEIKRRKPAVYAHIEKTNTRSIGVHQRCGFYKQLDYGRLLDGTVTSRYFTFCYR